MIKNDIYLIESIIQYNVPLIINDRIDVALAIDCAGVHVGQTDAPLEVARKLLGPTKVIGVSAGNIQQAQDAAKGGADYIGIGAVYGTQTKDVTNKIMGPAGARNVLSSLDPNDPIKTVVIGAFYCFSQINFLNFLFILLQK